jgi:hypothetical protein
MIEYVNDHERDFLYLNEYNLTYSSVKGYYRENNMWWIPEERCTCNVGYQLFDNLSDLQQRAHEVFARHHHRYLDLQQNLKRINNERNN